MDLRFPPPLAHGSLVGITSPSSGASGVLQPRVDAALQAIHQHGLQTRVGECMNGDGHVSAPVAQRAAEFQAMLLDPEIQAIIPPWGGETCIDLIPHLDWDAIAAAEPTWVVGFSDISTLLAPLTLRAGWATIHGNNLMDTPYTAPDGLVDWLDIITMPTGTTFTQTSPNAHRQNFVDYVEHPEVDTYELETPSRWERWDQPDQDLAVKGRLIGGCIDTIAHLAGTSYLDTTSLATDGEGLLVYVEAASENAGCIARSLHGMRLNGFFNQANAILVGRTYAPNIPGLTQKDAVLDALTPLGVPIIGGVDCGHWAPYMPLVNGAMAVVEHDSTSSMIHQTLA
ncbi:LD-carboxypeptidase [Arachnia propionica]|uniref:LD-carboxypeptidase n=1 Tax=Arachnia propionica TaxID=1750 RepID=A0AB37I3K6_9ACTN|nr:S66 peptidase family protein [Arachnia propionica]AFN46059.1 LD-carboxypeptidase [Arachnia propionica F0230a]QCT36767.1 LD-carboxypeptidase [Arachnia propionica]QUC10894.1 LD-carboxypeptidase [Arachnia propionica]RPA17776.1 LD-carboxypeptidase [Arachnia propionica]